MSSRIFSVPESLAWKQAYLAAVLEKDRAQVPGLVQKAKDKLSQRLRDLLTLHYVPCEESEAIDDAQYLLDALLSSLPYRHDIRYLTKWDEDN